MNKNDIIAVAICEAIVEKTEADWGADIIPAVKKVQEIKNWLTEVRSILQWLMNNEFIKRTDNFYVEHYVACVSANELLELINELKKGN